MQLKLVTGYSKKVSKKLSEFIRIKKRAEIAKIREDYFYKMLSEISEKEAIKYFEEDNEFYQLWFNQQNIMTSYKESIIVPFDLK